MAYNSLGVALKGDGKLEEAAMAFETAISLKENYGDAYARLAEVYNALGKHQEAIDTASKGLKYKGSHVGMCDYEIGTAYKKLGQYQEAIKYFEAAKKDRRWLKTADWEIENIKREQGIK